MVPLYAVPNVLEEAHRQVGHPEVVNTFDMIQRKFYWHGAGCIKLLITFLITVS